MSNNDKLEMEWLNEERQRLGMNPLPANVDAQDKKQYHVFVSIEAWERLQEIARDLGFEWGASRGAVGRLLEAIGQDVYEVRPKQHIERGTG